MPGISTASNPTPLTGWAGFAADVKNGWGINITADLPAITAADAMTFWLGGQPQWFIGNGMLGYVTILPNDNTYGVFDPNKPIQGFLGFSANPLNPFDGGASHIKPFYPDFDTIPPGFQHHHQCLSVLASERGRF